jgi:RHS repeat-associated protein
MTLEATGGMTQTLMDAACNTIAVIDPVGNQTSYVLDGLNRVVQQTDPAANVASFAYDAAGRLTAQTDRDGRQRVLAYDNDNRLTSDTWYDHNPTPVNTRTYQYDGDGNLTQASDNAGTYTMAYDELDRLTGQTDVWGLSLTYSYDSAGRLTQTQDSKGGVLTSAYDAADRLTSRQFSGDGQVAHDGQTPVRIDLGYDNRDEVTGLTRYADVSGSTPLGTSAFNYDSAGRLTNVTHKNAAGATLSYYTDGFDSADRVTSESWQSGSNSGSRSYTYDANDQLTSDGTSNWTYDLNGNRTNTGYQTNADNRLASDGTWNYTYDNEGNTTGKSLIGGNETWTYTFDNLDELTSATRVVSGVTQLQVTYTYDVFGNLVQESRYQPSTGTVTTRHAYDGQNVWADLDTSNNVLVRYVYGVGPDQPLARIVAAGQPNAGLAFYLTGRQGSVRDVMDASQTVQDHLDYDGYGNATETNLGYAGRYEYVGGWYDSGTRLVKLAQGWYAAADGRWVSQGSIGLEGADTNPYRYAEDNPTNAIGSSQLGLLGDTSDGIIGVIGDTCSSSTHTPPPWLVEARAIVWHNAEPIFDWTPQDDTDIPKASADLVKVEADLPRIDARDARADTAEAAADAAITKAEKAGDVPTLESAYTKINSLAHVKLVTELRTLKTYADSSDAYWRRIKGSRDYTDAKKLEVWRRREVYAARYAVLRRTQEKLSKALSVGNYSEIYRRLGEVRKLMDKLIVERDRLRAEGNMALIDWYFAVQYGDRATVDELDVKATAAIAAWKELDRVVTLISNAHFGPSR